MLLIAFKAVSKHKTVQRIDLIGVNREIWIREFLKVTLNWRFGNCVLHADVISLGLRNKYEDLQVVEDYTNWRPKP